MVMMMMMILIITPVGNHQTENFGNEQITYKASILHPPSVWNGRREECREHLNGIRLVSCVVSTVPSNKDSHWLEEANTMLNCYVVWMSLFLLRLILVWVALEYISRAGNSFERVVRSANNLQRLANSNIRYRGFQSPIMVGLLSSALFWGVSLIYSDLSRSLALSRSRSRSRRSCHLSPLMVVIVVVVEFIHGRETVLFMRWWLVCSMVEQFVSPSRINGTDGTCAQSSIGTERNGKMSVKCPWNDRDNTNTHNNTNTTITHSNWDEHCQVRVLVVILLLTLILVLCSCNCSSSSSSCV